MIAKLLLITLVAATQSQTFQNPEEVRGELLDQYGELLGNWFTGIIYSLFQDLINVRERSLPEAANLSVPDQIRAQGLKFEQHNVTTADGYILDLWHVWNATAPKAYVIDRYPGRYPSRRRRVAFFQHGLLDTAGTWWFNTPKNQLASQLADQGWDLWFGNNRGNVNSYLNNKLTVEDDHYWNNATQTEMGQYDVNTCIRFVLRHAHVTRLSYIGHAQGNTQFWIYNSQDNRLGVRIDKMVAYSPDMYHNNINSPFISLCLKTGIDKLILNTFWELLWVKPGYDRIDTFIYDYAPTVLSFFPRTTWTYVQGVVGVNAVSKMANTRMPMMARNDLGGSGTANLRLFMSNVRNGTFNDQNGNAYQVQKLKKNLRFTKILLVAGTSDSFAQPKDVDALQALLPNVERVNIKDYNNLDYMWAEDARKTINPTVIHFLNAPRREDGDEEVELDEYVEDEE